MNLDEYFIRTNLVCSGFKYVILVLERSLKAFLAIKDPLPAHLGRFSTRIEYDEDFAYQNTCSARLYITCLSRPLINQKYRLEHIA